MEFETTSSSRIAAFDRCTQGSIAASFALLLVAVCGIAALAVDLGQAYGARQRAQAKLDSALLAATTATTEQEARQTFVNYLAAAGLDESKGTFEWTAVDGHFVAKATYTDATSANLARAIGLNEFPYEVWSEAATPKTVASFSINIKNAYGWSDKTVEFWIERKDGTRAVVATVVYTLTSTAGAGGRGTGTTVVSPSGDISVSDMKFMWVVMRVRTHTGAHFTFTTQDTATANHVFVDGRQLAPGDSAIASLLPCDHTASYALEDTDKPLGAAQWDQQDLFFDVSTICSIPDGAQARLTK